jgi:tetratricopeptide (TPR) repeat protein
MNLSEILKQRMDEWVFIELKEPIAIPQSEGVVPALLPLPIRTETMAGWVKSDIGTEIQLENLIVDLAMVMGIDETFPHYQTYHQLLEELTGHQIRAALEKKAQEFFDLEMPNNAMVLLRTLTFLYPQNHELQFSFAVSVERFAEKRIKEGASRAGAFLYELAAKEYLRLIQEAPEIYAAHYKLGHYYAYNNQYQAAQHQFQRFLEVIAAQETLDEVKLEVRETLQAITPYALYEEAVAYSQTGQFEEAIHILENLVGRDKEWWQAELLLGICYRGVNQLEKAMSHMQRSEFLKEDEPMILFEIAQTQYLLGQYQEAMGSIQKTIGAAREWPEAYLVRAQIYLALNQVRDGISDLRKVLQLNPEQAAAKQLLARLGQDS